MINKSHAYIVSLLIPYFEHRNQCSNIVEIVNTTKSREQVMFVFYRDYLALVLMKDFRVLF